MVVGCRVEFPSSRIGEIYLVLATFPLPQCARVYQTFQAYPFGLLFTNKSESIFFSQAGARASAEQATTHPSPARERRGHDKGKLPSRRESVGGTSYHSPVPGARASGTRQRKNKINSPFLPPAEKNQDQFSFSQYLLRSRPLARPSGLFAESRAAQRRRRQSKTLQPADTTFPNNHPPSWPARQKNLRHTPHLSKENHRRFCSARQKNQRHTSAANK